MEGRNWEEKIFPEEDKTMRDSRDQRRISHTLDGATRLPEVKRRSWRKEARSSTKIGEKLDSRLFLRAYEGSLTQRVARTCFSSPRAPPDLESWLSIWGAREIHVVAL